MAQEKVITWEILKNLTDALDSYRVRALIDAKKDILTEGVYSEQQYSSLLLKTIEEEKLKYALFEKIKQGKIYRFNHILDFSEQHSIETRKTYSLLRLLQIENLINIEKIYDTKDQDTIDSQEGVSIPLFKDLKISIINQDFHEVKSIYEPVSVIFDSNICSGCGMCANVCPMNCLDVLNGFGKFEEQKCIRCGLCYFACPRSYLPIDVLNMTMDNSSKIKNYSPIGSYLKIYSARTKIKEILENCQDGGISSTCLYYLFDKGKIRQAIGAKMSDTVWRPEPFILKSKEDVLLTLGTKYVNNPSLKILKTLNNINSDIAVVGVPCMMQALLKSNIYDINFPVVNNIQYRIGIFCMESFPYQSILEICQKLDIDINQVVKMDINKGKFLLYTKNNKELNIPIKDITHLAREDCEFCFDLTSESADISVGSIGSPSGWNTVIIRTKNGEQLFKQLIKENLIESKDIEEVKPGLPLLLKISASKKKKCEKHIELRKIDGNKHPNY